MENLVPMTVEDDSREAPASLQAIEKYASDGPCAQTAQLPFCPMARYRFNLQRWSR
jgi:hypothetical protein